MEHDQGRALAGMGAPPKAPGGAGWPEFEQSLAGCPVCGQALPQPGPCPNRWCRRADRGFSVVFAVGVHDGALRHAILRYKYRRETWWAGIFARLFADHLRTHATWFEEFDLLVPVPAYTGPRARRDWDPVGEIAGAPAAPGRPAVGDRRRRRREAGGDAGHAGSPLGRPPGDRGRAPPTVAGGAGAGPGVCAAHSGPRRRADRGRHPAGGGPGTPPGGGARGRRVGPGQTGVEGRPAGGAAGQWSAGWAVGGRALAVGRGRATSGRSPAASWSVLGD